MRFSGGVFRMSCIRDIDQVLPCRKTAGTARRTVRSVQCVKSSEQPHGSQLFSWYVPGQLRLKQNFIGEGNSPSINSDGRDVAYSRDTNGVSQVFINDGAKVSVNNAGNEGNAASSEPAISGDGRFVAFVSNCHQPGGGGQQQRCGHLRP